ncbi:MAG: hypothetical protein AAGD14_15845 [Planctomycetota bacterium]
MPLLLGALIIAATVGGMIWVSGGDDETEAQASENKPVDENVIEVEPMVPQGRIASASWRTGETATPSESEAETVSLLDSVEWGNLNGSDDARKKRNEESLRKAMSQLNGLGVVVAEEDDEEEE